MDELDSEITKKIDALTSADWQELQKLHKRVGDFNGDFSTMGGGQEIAENTIEMPYVVEDPLLADVRMFFYDRDLVVPFNWSEWEAGKRLLDGESEDKFADVSAADVVKLFTASIRNDRFSEGAFANLFKSGDAAKLLERLLSFRPAE